MIFQPGSLVTTRNREWIVLPSNDPDLVLLKPLGGSDEEITGIYKDLNFVEDKITSYNFPIPNSQDIGDLNSARILYNACRLSFRNGAGPFRSIGKLSFRPRSYQMVPLIMALKQSPVRLLIADDVGIGKTIEALLIVKELLERKTIERFAIICLPHLCEQWQAELKDKFGIEAVIIRSNTQAQLDRQVHGDISVYNHYPYQVISIDYIKSDRRREVFIQECPELIVVDEAHTATKPSGATKGQQLRYKLIHDIAAKDNQNVVLLTATPHSGKSEEFQSLLGLLNPQFEKIDLANADQKKRRKIASHFVQRRRGDILKWLKEETPFPKRDLGEIAYNLSPVYANFYNKMLDFTQGLLVSGDDSPKNQQRMRYWSALALLRGIMSSPAAGAEMLKNRVKKLDNADLHELTTNPIQDEDYGYEGDHAPSDVLSQNDWSKTQIQKLNEFRKDLDKLHNLKADYKAKQCFEIIQDWLKKGFSPVVFCRYIATAKYLGELLQKELGKKKNTVIEIITSEDPDEIRRARIEEMGKYEKRVLIATDCLSEGINLQEYFTAVLHYDLPWNPTDWNREREEWIDLVKLLLK